MNETYNYKVAVEPFADLKIDISGAHAYSENFSEYFRADEFGIFQFYTPTTSGSFSMSFLMNKTSFTDGDELFKRLCDYREVIANRLANENETWASIGSPMVYDSIGSGIFPFGYGASSQEVLTYAFLAAYSGQSPDEVSLTLFRRFALPNWNLSFTGLTRIPAIKKIFKTVNVTHSYKSTYAISTWANNINYNAEMNMAVYEGTNMRVPEYDMSQIMLSEQYAPLVGVTLAFKNSLAPSFEFKKSKTVVISFSNNQITENAGREIVVGLGYTFKGLSFNVGMLESTGTKKVSNDLKIKLDIGFRRDITTLRSIDECYSQVSSGQDKINIYLTGDYNFSQRLGAQAFFKYDMTNPFIANSYKTTNVFAGLTMRFSLTQ